MSKTIPSQDLRNAKLRLNPTCVTCGITKTVEDFPKRAVDYTCTKCRGEYVIRKYHEKRSVMTPEKLAELKSNINKRQNERRTNRLLAMSKEDEAAYRQQINADNTRRRYEVRDAVYQAYGGYRCACCGVTEKSFLSIDHINNDGAEHKRKCKLQTGEQLYRWLVRNKFPSGFQILCMNCQWGKRNNNGVCPHESGKV